jgi:hypothetical protein
LAKRLSTKRFDARTTQPCALGADRDHQFRRNPAQIPDGRLYRSF